MSFHRFDELMFIGPGIESEHRIEPVYPEQVPNHLPMGGTGTCIADGPIICDSLHRRNRGSDDAFSGDTFGDYLQRGDIPDDPWGERTAGFLERIEHHYSD